MTPLVLAIISCFGVWPCAIVALILCAKNLRKLANHTNHHKYPLVLKTKRIATISLVIYAVLTIVYIILMVVEIGFLKHQYNNYHRSNDQVLQMSLR